MNEDLKFEDMLSVIKSLLLVAIGLFTLNNLVLIATLAYTLLNFYYLLLKIKKEKKDGHPEKDSL